MIYVSLLSLKIPVQANETDQQTPPTPPYIPSSTSTTANTGCLSQYLQVETSNHD